MQLWGFQDLWDEEKERSATLALCYVPLLCLIRLPVGTPQVRERWLWSRELGTQRLPCLSVSWWKSICEFRACWPLHPCPSQCHTVRRIERWLLVGKHPASPVLDHEFQRTCFWHQLPKRWQIALEESSGRAFLPHPDSHLQPIESRAWLKVVFKKLLKVNSSSSQDARQVLRSWLVRNSRKQWSFNFQLLLKQDPENDSVIIIFPTALSIESFTVTQETTFPTPGLQKRWEGAITLSLTSLPDQYSTPFQTYVSITENNSNRGAQWVSTVCGAPAIFTTVLWLALFPTSQVRKLRSRDFFSSLN